MISKMLQIQPVRFFTWIIQSKRILLLIAIVFAFNTVFAQNALKIYKHDGSITNINASAIDSIKFNTPLFIGASYQGGIIFYLDASGEHGLIAAPTDQSTGIQWWNGSYTTTGATGDGVDSGKANTYMIVGNQGIGSYAAELCRDLHLGGYADWYLPSKYELNLMYLQKANIGGFATNGYYWSSSEDNISNAWVQYFFDGSQDSYYKYYTEYVRAVRAF